MYCRKWAVFAATLVFFSISVTAAAPIHVAASRGDIPALRRLLKRNPKLVNSMGRLPGSEGLPAYYSPLYYASKEGKLDAVRFLLQNRAEPNLSGETGYTALHVAPSAKIAKLLVGAGARTDLMQETGATALHVACTDGRMDVARFLRTRTQKLDIWEAAALGDAKRVRQLLRADPKQVRAEDRAVDDEQPLHLAGSASVAKLLISKGASVNARSAAFDTTPLHEAAGRGANGVVRLLLAHRANIESPDQLGRTPLHFAAGSGNVKTVAYLISRGATVNAKTTAKSVVRARVVPAGSTPLRVAVIIGNHTISRYLRKHGGR